MPHCYILKCSSNSSKKDPSVGFYRFPSINYKNLEDRCQGKKRFEAWVQALNRGQFEPQQLKHARICSRHFASGRSSGLWDEDDPDWVPNRCLELATTDHSKDRLNCYNRRKRELLSSATSGPTKLIKMEDHNYSSITANSSDDSSSNASQNYIVSKTSHETAVASENIELQQLRSTLQFYISRTRELEGILKSYKFDLDNLADPKKCRFFTGISSNVTLKSILDLVSNGMPNYKMPKEERFILCLMRLRLNLSSQFLAYHFKVTESTASKYFLSTLYPMYIVLKSCISWPQRNILEKNLPKRFKANFDGKVIVIMDCLEDMSNNLALKSVVVISSSGQIICVSKGDERNAIDRITNEVDFFNNLKEGDIVVARQGLLLTNDENTSCTTGTNNLPAFKVGNNKLVPFNGDEYSLLANVRTHVERVIDEFREKYPILTERFPISEQQNEECVIEQIVTICCGLINSSPTILSRIS